MDKPKHLFQRSIEITIGFNAFLSLLLLAKKCRQIKAIDIRCWLSKLKFFSARKLSNLPVASSRWCKHFQLSALWCRNINIYIIQPLSRKEAIGKFKIFRVLKNFNFESQQKTSIDLFWRHFFARGNTNVATSELGLTKKITFYQKVSKRVVIWYVRSNSQWFGETKWCDLVWPVNVIWFDRWSEMIQFDWSIQIISTIDTHERAAWRADSVQILKKCRIRPVKRPNYVNQFARALIT